MALNYMVKVAMRITSSQYESSRKQRESVTSAVYVLEKFVSDYLTSSAAR
jgi:hypothetical protein